MKENKHVEYIYRQKLLYESDVEYGDYCVNHVLGCPHGCRYCFAMKDHHRWHPQDGYVEWCKPKLVINALDILKREIPRLKHGIDSVQLSFTTDPFPFQREYFEISQMSLEIIKLLNANGIKCRVLTKGVLPEVLSRFPIGNELGVTVTSTDENFRKFMEPNAAPYRARIESLKYMHDRGQRTWASLEPIFTPNVHEVDLIKLLNSVGFVDKIIFGRCHHEKDITAWNNYKDYYNYLSSVVKDFCWKRGIEVHIKDKTITPHSMCTIVSNMNLQ